jgi:hypothetical protein
MCLRNKVFFLRNKTEMLYSKGVWLDERLD